jgi:hypothetical protein
MGMKSTGGEIVQVQGGHIVRATGRKDRHSKVYTAKGPRDRRVRLSAHTAIQFYDVQDRLGYDRPSKAVDWLIKKAKSAIDKLDQLPPWNPIPNATEVLQEEGTNNNAVETNEMVIAAENSESSGYNMQQNNHNHNHNHNHHNHSAFIQSSIDNDAIAFFPTTSVAETMNFQSYSSDIISRTNNSTQDLGLSLHSFQDNSGSNDQTLFSESNPVGFDTNYHRIVNWNNDHGTTDMNRTGFMVNSPSFLGQGSAFSAHRGTLQSSFSPSLRPWNDIPMTDSSVDHHNHKSHSHQPIHQASIFGSRFLSDALTGFCIPARIQGDDESHGVGSKRPSSASNSHH